MALKLTSIGKRKRQVGAQVPLGAFHEVHVAELDAFVSSLARTYYFA
jgi:hypothetical protein